MAAESVAADAAADHAPKRAKTADTSAESEAAQLPFHPTLLTPDNIKRLADEHANSKPYKHGVITGLFEPEFLKKAREEIVSQISFREKETDIYKINQTGDLTNLSGLPTAERALLPTLISLRDALYSQTFRSFVQAVTGCGPLSGIKTDMSCAEYSQGCYLLNHDDVIGTRRISFILYLVLDQPAWRPEWGGALELYPVKEGDAEGEGAGRPNVPEAKPSVSIPPAFNQFAFFTVQPGHSFHSVEEVVVHGDGEKGGVGARVSLSGWFHSPVEGEAGYDGAEEYAAKSSLQQLYATTLEGSKPYDSEPVLPLPTSLSPADLAALSPLVNPAYLSSTLLGALRNNFVSQSQLVLADFLKKEIADELDGLLRLEDGKMEAGRRGAQAGQCRTDLIPAQDAGEGEGWTVVGPPHLQRYCALDPSTPSSALASAASPRLVELLAQVRGLFDSDAFRSLLAALSALLPLARTVAVRRFRPGLDYTLARGEPVDEGEPRLDVGLGLTPVPQVEEDAELWESGEVGAWELWIVGDEGGDEATYGTGGGGGQKKGEEEEAREGESAGPVVTEAGAGGEAQAEEGEAEEEEEDDGPLLALPPGWNQLTLVLRDPGVLKFVKYASARAPGSRWDVGGEWEVGMVEEEGEDDEDED